MKAMSAAEKKRIRSAHVDGASIAARSNQAPPQRSSLQFVYYSSHTVANGDKAVGPASNVQRMSRYAGNLAHLMGARLSCAPATSQANDEEPSSGVLSAGDCDLLLLESQAPGALLESAKQALLPSVLIIRQGIWPIKRILVLMRGQATDAATVEWVLRLAALSGSRVTALVVLSSRQQRDCRRSEIADVLARDTTPGRYMRQVLNRMSALNIDCVLRVRQGLPACQVRHEVTRRLHDLVITSIEPPGRLLDRHLEGLIEPLLQWTSAPVLVARLPSIWLEERKR